MDDLVAKEAEGESDQCDDDDACWYGQLMVIRHDVQALRRDDGVDGTPAETGDKVEHSRTSTLR